MFSSKHFPSILAFSLVIFLSGVLVASAKDVDLTQISYDLLEPLPLSGDTSLTTTVTISSYLSGVFKLIIALGAAFAILMGITGGIQYVASGIAPSAKQGAKDRITDALIGLAIVLSSYLILNTINPELVEFNLSLPAISGTSATTTTTTTTGYAAGSSSATGCMSNDDCLASEGYKCDGYGTAIDGGITPGTCVSIGCTNPNTTSACCLSSEIGCTACSNCLSVGSGVNNKGCGLTTCYLNKDLLSKVEKISETGWRVTESWPPTVNHQSSCHQNGTCADLNNTDGATDTATIKKYYDGFKDAGLNVLYESKDCTAYITAGVTNCKTYDSMTNGSSFHVY